MSCSSLFSRTAICVTLCLFSNPTHCTCTGVENISTGKKNVYFSPFRDTHHPRTKNSGKEKNYEVHYLLRLLQRLSIHSIVAIWWLGLALFNGLQHDMT